MSGVKPREERTAAAVGLMFLAVVLFTCIDTSAKWLILAGLVPLQVVFVRYAGHLIYALIAYLPQEGMSALQSRAPGRQALRSAFLLGSTVFNFMALSALPITLTTTIAFAMPIVVTLLAIPLLGERVGKHRIGAVIVGFLGVLVVTRPWGADWHPAILYSLISLTLAALYFLTTRLLAGIETNATQQIWSSALATTVLLPFVVSTWQWPSALPDWIAFIAIGFFGLSGHTLATIAHRWADASILSPMMYSQLFLAALAGVLVFDTPPTVWTFGGGLIIIGSGLYIWHRERRTAAPPDPS